jgi:ribosomal protein S18 acetylase RimI-like enzyme
VELRAEDLAAYVRLVAPDKPETLDRLCGEIERGQRLLADTRVARSGSGELLAAVRLAPQGPGLVVLAGPFGDDGAAAGLVPEALARARDLGARLVRNRPRVALLGPRYRAALLAHGFKDLGERIEFKVSVAELPLDDGTPLEWRTLGDVGLDHVAETLARVAEGDPRGTEEHDDPRGSIAEILGAPDLTRGPDCVQVGYLGGKPVAFVSAQVQPSDGWARIAYIGVVPEARGRGLGAWVHRHGFRMLRDQGGKLYHGGTAATNAPMLRLFRAHGCKEAARMFEFEWRPA